MRIQGQYFGHAQAKVVGLFAQETTEKSREFIIVIDCEKKKIKFGIFISAIIIVLVK